LLSELTPGAPDWTIDWDAIAAEFSWPADLEACEQGHEYHAEGNVWIHTRMVGDALAEMPAFRALDDRARAIVFCASILHDIGKPATTRVEDDGRITARGHSVRGEILARAMLWRAGADFSFREAVCGLIRYHQVPFFAVDQDDAERKVFRVSHVVRCDWLSLVAAADGRGRRCADASDQQRILDNVELFEELCREHACWHGPREFASDHSRFIYFRKEDRDPSYAAYDDTICEVTVMAGLPGVGKSTWIAEHAGEQAVISLDALRTELGIDPAEPQGRVIAAARESAREHLRAKRPFVWDATNISRELRTQIVTLFADYNARVRFVYVEVPESTLRTRNRARERPVPDKVIDRMIGRWTLPTPVDAHRVEHVIDDTMSR
jgi:predicted kinase